MIIPIAFISFRKHYRKQKTRLRNMEYQSQSVQQKYKGNHTRSLCIMKNLVYTHTTLLILLYFSITCELPKKKLRKPKSRGRPCGVFYRLQNCKKLFLKWCFF
uniref:Uncharacterized protein n=1 Tax=Cacopsylla melanoneura TaxID=428564 RepID=A0A8D8XSP2_9HEMI